MIWVLEKSLLSSLLSVWRNWSLPGITEPCGMHVSTLVAVQMQVIVVLNPHR